VFGKVVIVVNNMHGSAARAHAVKEYYDSAAPWWGTRLYDARTISKYVCNIETLPYFEDVAIDMSLG
jgi:hypothetical protein